MPLQTLEDLAILSELKFLLTQSRCCRRHGMRQAFTPGALSVDNADFRLYELLKNNSHASMANPSCPGALPHQQLGFASELEEVVEDDGIEPTTPCLQSRCSPS